MVMTINPQTPGSWPTIALGYKPKRPPTRSYFTENCQTPHTRLRSRPSPPLYKENKNPQYTLSPQIGPHKHHHRQPLPLSCCTHSLAQSPLRSCLGKRLCDGEGGLVIFAHCCSSCSLTLSFLQAFVHISPVTYSHVNRHFIFSFFR